MGLVFNWLKYFVAGTNMLNDHGFLTYKKYHLFDTDQCYFVHGNSVFMDVNLFLTELEIKPQCILTKLDSNTDLHSKSE